jgi:hypothetical protein
MAWYQFAELFHKYKTAETTNYVEGLHAVRRKWLDKRINFKQSYVCRANMSLLSSFLNNWIQLVLDELKIPIDISITEYMEVICNVFKKYNRHFLWKNKNQEKEECKRNMSEKDIIKKL